jgi:hypothetical protein
MAAFGKLITAAIRVAELDELEVPAARGLGAEAHGSERAAW